MGIFTQTPTRKKTTIKIFPKSEYLTIFGQASISIYAFYSNERAEIWIFQIDAETTEKINIQRFHEIFCKTRQSRTVSFKTSKSGLRFISKL